MWIKWGRNKVLHKLLILFFILTDQKDDYTLQPPAQAFLSNEGWRAGSLFIWMSQRYLEQFEDVRFETLRGANARKVVLMVGIMAAHALGEGSGVGVSFCGQRGWSQVC